MKRLIYMLIASTILFCNIDNVGAIKHTISSKNAAEDAKRGSCFYIVPSDSSSKTKPFTLRCYIYEDYNSDCFDDKEAHGNISNWITDKGAGFVAKDYIDKNKVCPQAVLVRVKTSLTGNDLIYLGASKSDLEQIIKKENLNEKKYEIGNYISGKILTPTSSDTSNDKNFGEVLGGIAGEIAGGVANNVEENIQHVIDGTEIVVNGTENAIDGAGNIMNSIVNGVTGGTSSDNNPGGIGGDSPIDSDTGGITFDGTKISGCKVFGDEDSQTWKIVNWIVHLLIYGIPILVVLLGIVDFLGVVFSGEEDKMKEAQKKVIMRLVVGIVFLFVPSILKFIIDISGTFTGVASSDLFCGFI